MWRIEDWGLRTEEYELRKNGLVLKKRRFPLENTSDIYTAFHNNVQNYAIADLRHIRVYGCRKKLEISNKKVL